ncbi:uncharacterized protein Hap1MRO34_022894 isoform 1-T3 [Clarias gariepinus]
MRSLCKLVQERPEKRDVYLESVMFGLRTKKQLTAKFSPFFLMFGTKARYPCEVPDKYKIDSNVEKAVGLEVVAEAIQRQESIFSVVQKNIKRLGRCFHDDMQYPDTVHVINAYLAMLEQQHNKTSIEKVFYIDSFAISVWTGKIPRFRWDPKNYKLLFGLVNEHHHWFLVVIYPLERRTFLLDSLGETPNKFKKCEDTTSLQRKYWGKKTSHFQLHIKMWKIIGGRLPQVLLETLMT